jgi:hypothetical protein
MSRASGFHLNLIRETKLAHKSIHKLMFALLCSTAHKINSFRTRYRAKSAEGRVRHAFFKGLREDL